jgi:predicted ester cyclase
LRDILASEVVHHAAGGYPKVMNAAGVTAMMGDFLAAFPDLRYGFDRFIVRDDYVVERYTATGTQQGPLGDLPASGRTATWTGINIFRIACGRIAEVWSEVDALTRTQHLTGVTGSAAAQDAIPDLKGTWTATTKAVVFETSGHHPGSETPDQGARIRDVTFAFKVEGQAGRNVWGTLSSPTASERFVWAISHDNRTILGSDRDGTFLNRLLGPDKLEICYTQSDNYGKTGSALAAVCHVFDRKP